MPQGSTTGAAGFSAHWACTRYGSGVADASQSAPASVTGAAVDRGLSSRSRGLPPRAAPRGTAAGRRPVRRGTGRMDGRACREGPGE
ncbi:hypothetical protein, partial [Streptomyces sp. UNOC14_S4]|uniref:hypothetical protein n=1 Tax=Streptomyces sp. UNOC14_S4 TaxID=2872340 RepID=UPI001E4B0DC1